MSVLAGNRVYLDDATLLVLAAGGDPRDQLLERLADHVKQEGEIYTSSAALESVQEYFLARGTTAGLRQFWNALDGLFREILPLRGEDLGRALDVLEWIESGEGVGGGPSPRVALRPTQALHAAIVLNHRIEWMVDLEHCYDAIPGIKAFEF